MRNNLLILDPDSVQLTGGQITGANRLDGTPVLGMEIAVADDEPVELAFNIPVAKKLHAILGQFLEDHE